MKRIKVFLRACFVLFITLFCVSCGNNIPKENIEDVELAVFTEKNQVKNNRKAKIILSYEDSTTDLWNYVIDIGHVSNVPLSNLKDPKVYQKYTKQSTEQTYSFSTTSTKKETIKEATQKCVELATESSTGVSLGTKVADSAGFKIGIDNNNGFSATKAVEVSTSLTYKIATNSSSKYSSSYEEASEISSTVSETRNIKFSPNSATGYYGYCLTGTIEVYAHVTYDPDHEAVDIQFFGEVIAQAYSFDYLTVDEYEDMVTGYELEDQFDFVLPELTEPESIISIEDAYSEVNSNFVTVLFDTNGGYFEKNLDTMYVLENGKFGELPIPVMESDSYFFDGWYDANDRKITSDTICNFQDSTTLTAKWLQYKFSHSYSNFYLENTQTMLIPITKSMTLNLDITIDKSKFISAGYKYYAVNIEYTIKAQAPSMGQEYDLTINANGVALGSRADRTIKDGYVNETYTSVEGEKFSINSLNEFNNTIGVVFINNNYIYGFSVNGATVTVTFYKE